MLKKHASKTEPKRLTQKELLEAKRALNEWFSQNTREDGNFGSEALDVLSISGGQAAEIPDEVFEWLAMLHPNIAVIRLNQWPKLKTLPRTIDGHRNLRALSVSECPDFDALPAELGALSIQTVQLRKCKLSEVPGVLCDMPSLQCLRIIDCPITRLPGDFIAYDELLTVNLSETCLDEDPKALYRSSVKGQREISFGGTPLAATLGATGAIVPQLSVMRVLIARGRRAWRHPVLVGTFVFCCVFACAVSCLVTRRQ